MSKAQRVTSKLLEGKLLESELVINDRKLIKTDKNGEIFKYPI